MFVQMQHNQQPQPLGLLDFMHWVLSIVLPNASVTSRKNIVMSAFSELTYSETAMKRISSTFSVYSLKLPINKGLFVQNMARGNSITKQGYSNLFWCIPSHIFTWSSKSRLKTVETLLKIYAFWCSCPTVTQ